MKSRLALSALTISVTLAGSGAALGQEYSPQGFPVPPRRGGDTSLSTALRKHPDYTSAYGSPAEPDSAERIVRVSPSLRSVTVAYGETVKFIVDGENGSERSFAWRFDGSPALTHVDLSEVAPTDLPAQNLRVFVAPGSRSRGG